MVYPELQRRQITRARKRRLRTSVLKGLASTASPFGSLLLPSGDLNDEVRLIAESVFSNLSAAVKSWCRCRLVRMLQQGQKSKLSAGWKAFHEAPFLLMMVFSNNAHRW